MIESDREPGRKFDESAGQSESTLLPMLVAGLGLIVAGLVVVAFFV
jgi:hypothetical protein